MRTCARPSCGNELYFEHSEMCGACLLAEEYYAFAVEFDRLESLDRHYEEHRARHDRREKPVFRPYLVKASADPCGTRYGRAGLRNIITRLADRDDRNNGLFFAARCTGELVAGGQLDGKYALDTLLEAAELLAPDERWKSKDTIARGMRVGLENPKGPRMERAA